MVVAGLRPRVKSTVTGFVFGWSLLLAVFLVQLFHGHGFDDPYITYRYSINLAHGDGFVYNVGVRVLSTTTPLYTLILTPMAWLGVDLPLISNVLGCLCLVLGGLAFWELGQTSGARWAGLTGLLLYPISPLLLPTLGAESCLYCALILWGCVWYLGLHYNRAALMLSLAILTRADGVLIVIVLLIHWCVWRRGLPPWRALMLGLLLTAPWFIWAWWYFDVPFPVTLAAKQHQAQLPQSIRFFAGFVAKSKRYWAQPLYRFYGLLGVVGLAYGSVRQRWWLLLPFWDVIYLAAYHFLGVTSYFWYYAPLAVGVVALVGLGVEAMARLLDRLKQRQITIVSIAGLLLVLLLAEGLDLRRAVQQPDTRLGIYRRVGEWLDLHTAPDAMVGTLEVGIIGFYSQRTMIDFAGLIQPETALQLGPTTSYEDAAIWAIERFRPQYLVILRGGFARLVRDPVMATCSQLMSFSDATYPGLIDVYHCPPNNR